MKKTVSYIGGLGVLLLGLLIGCTTEKARTPEAPAMNFTVNPEEIVIPQAGGNATMDIATDRSWAIVPGEGTWYAISGDGLGEAGEQQVVLTAAENHGTAVRTSLLKVNAGRETKEVTVSQYGSDPAILMALKSKNVGFLANSCEMTVHANAELSYTSDAWLTVSAPYALNSNTYRIQVAENTGIARDGKVTFTVAGGSSEIFTVKQAAFEYRLTLDKEKLAVGGLQDKGVVAVTASADWTLSFPHQQPVWITKAVTSGKKGTNNVTFEFAPNATGGANSCEVLFSCGTATHTLTIVQSAVKGRELDSLVLVKIYKAAAKRGSDVWDLTKPMTTWDPRNLLLNKEDRVSSVMFFGWTFNEIPAEIGNLNSLENLTFSGVDFKNGLPESVSQLTNLTKLVFVGCFGSLNLPDSYKNLTKLEMFSMYGPYDGVMDISVFPAVLLEIPSLRTIDLSATKITKIPDGISKLTNLESLKMDNTLITGIPASLGELKKLQFVYFNGCRLVGEIPAELGNAVSLETFVASGNQLSGPIPLSIYKLKNLTTFRVGMNNLTGEISKDLAASNIQVFYVNDNRLGGSNSYLPEEVLNDDRFKKALGGWNGSQMICKQQENYGFKNCPE